MKEREVEMAGSHQTLVQSDLEGKREQVTRLLCILQKVQQGYLVVLEPKLVEEELLYLSETDLLGILDIVIGRSSLWKVWPQYRHRHGFPSAAAGALVK